jgi:signal transduction histidine kinase
MSMLNYLSQILPASFKKLTVEEQRKWTIVLSINIVTIAIQAFYLYRYNTYYDVPLANYFISTCMTFNLFGFYFFFKKQYEKAAVAVLIPGTLDLIFLIFLAGGINAPGTFWLAILPFFYGMFFGKIGSIVGAVVTFSTYGIYFLLYQLGYRDTVVTEDVLFFERVSNLFNYTLITALYYISYTAAFERSNKKLNASKELIDNLFRVVLHDITNPISAIKMRLDLMKKKSDKESLDGLEKMEISVKKVISILENLRDYKAIDDGTISIPMTEVPMAQAVSKFVEETGEFASNKGVDLQLKIDLSQNTKVYGNIETLCSQIFANIFSNAVKFSEPGDVITVKAFQSNNVVIVEISDNGMGIPDKILENLFRFDKPTSRVGTTGEQGTGYGLPIMKYFLELMNAKVEVQSSTDDSPSRGTCFKMSFPAL